MIRIIAAFPTLISLFAATMASAQQGGGTQPAALLPNETLLQVAAHGTAKAVPDVATLATSVVGYGGSAEAARSKVAETTAHLIAAARAAGATDDAMRTQSLHVAPRFKSDKDGDDTNVVVGYRAESKLSIRLRDVSLVAPVFDAVIAAGATGIDGPDFAFSEDTTLKRRARANAVAAAQVQAEDYAKPFGLHVARVLRINERRAETEGGQDIIVTAQRRSSRTPPVLPGEQEVTTDVWIDFALSR